MNLRRFLSTLMLVTVISLMFTSAVFAVEEETDVAKASVTVAEEEAIGETSGEITDDKEVAKAATEAEEEAVESGESGKLEENVKPSGEVLAANDQLIAEKSGEEAEEDDEATISGDVAKESGDEAEESGEKAVVSGDKAEVSGDEATISGDVATKSGDEADKSGEEAVVSGDKAEASGEKEEAKLPVDVTEDRWFANYVADAVKNDYMEVNEKGEFRPYDKLTKREAVEALTKLENPTGEGALDNDIESTEEITREEVADLVYKIAKAKGKGFSDEWLVLLEFEDVLEISGSHYEAVAWCNVNKIMVGRPGNVIGARDVATRAELATILVRLADVI